MFVLRWLDCSASPENGSALDCQPCRPGAGNDGEFRTGLPLFGPSPGYEEEEVAKAPKAPDGALLALRGALPRGPAQRGLQVFEAAGLEKLDGPVLLEGSVTQLILGQSMHDMCMAVHVNGFHLEPAPGAASDAPKPMSRAWSPFSLVDRCEVAGVFKLLVFRGDGTDTCFYFRTQGHDAEREKLCSLWVETVALAIADVTHSLFPPHAIDVRPLSGVPETSMRIMAGYLLKAGRKDSLMLFYCELRAYGGGEAAKLSLYVDEDCTQEVQVVQLTSSMTICGRPGAFSTVFGVDRHRFCARSEQEKEVWIRALSNIKVKLLFQAPEPTEQDLEVFRGAVRERVEALPPPLLRTPQEREAGERSLSSTPLLSKVPREPPSGPCGDHWDPDPVDDKTEVGFEEELCVVSLDSPTALSPGAPRHDLEPGGFATPTGARTSGAMFATPVAAADEVCGDAVISLDGGSPALRATPAVGAASLDSASPATQAVMSLDAHETLVISPDDMSAESQETPGACSRRREKLGIRWL